jgi:hypothetical protein
VLSGSRDRLSGVGTADRVAASYELETDTYQLGYPLAVVGASDDAGAVVDVHGMGAEEAAAVQSWIPERELIRHGRALRVDDISALWCPHHCA